MEQLREKSAEQFAKASFPSSKDEAWRNTDITPILEHPFRRAKGWVHAEPSAAAPFLFNTPGWHELIFIDGVYQMPIGNESLLEAGVVAGNLSRANGRGVDGHFGPNGAAIDAFAALNGAMTRDGALVVIPEGAQARTQVHLLYIATGKEPWEGYFPRNFIYAGANSNLTVVETHVALAGAHPHLSNAVTDIMLGDNADISYGKHIAHGGGYHIGSVNVHQSRDSRFHSACVSTTGLILRNAVHVSFSGPGAECRLDGLYLNAGGQLVDHTLSIDHSRPNCLSRIAYKGIVAADGRAVYRGGVRVEKDAQGTDSNQVNRNLLLSDQARVDTTPQLEIYADDVKCTHGATVGSPPDDVLFYFRSRGISEAEARAMLTRGFAGEIVGRIPQEPWRKALWKYLEGDFLKRQGG
jgi:Fe-S cluster assembly protein SufD